jgi:hypothetical protein
MGWCERTAHAGRVLTSKAARHACGERARGIGLRYAHKGNSIREAKIRALRGATYRSQTFQHRLRATAEVLLEG